MQLYLIKYGGGDYFKFPFEKSKVIRSVVKFGIPDKAMRNFNSLL